MAALDTLTPYQTEYNPLALRSKGFTSPTRTLSPGKDTEDASGLDYLKIMKGIAGDSDGLPTVLRKMEGLRLQLLHYLKNTSSDRGPQKMEVHSPTFRL